MYRTTPVWYLDGLGDVMLKFSSTMSSDRPRNLLLGPSFPNPVLDSDGVHLTPYSGYGFVLHLFDAAADLIKSLAQSPETFVLSHNESIRALEDRVVVLEQDHRRLNTAFEDKTAVDAEADDFLENQRHEDSFIISGLRKIQSGLSTKEWQEKAQQDVREAVAVLLNREPRVVVVHNQTGVRKVTTYLVQLESTSDACAIRAKFGSFFAGGKDRRPPALKEVSIGNWVTPGTKVRIAILKVLAEKYRASNPGSRVQVVGYQSRPLIKLTPPSGAKDRRLKVFNFVQAIRNLPTNFSPDQIKSIMAKVNPNLYTRLRSLFLVLDDDMPKIHRAERTNPNPVPPDQSASASVSAPSSPQLIETSGSPTHDGSGSGTGSSRPTKRAATPPRTKSSKSTRK